MSRPTKCRRICHSPRVTRFAPPGDGGGKAVILTVDEYECIRLIDKQGFSQEQCAHFMQIARTTVQKIYDEARRKIAAMIVDGLPLEIAGGEYRLCDGRNAACFQRCCEQRQLSEEFFMAKGDTIMRIAVTYEDGQVFQHFGHSQQIKVYDVEEGKIAATRVVDTSATGHGALVGVLKALNVDALICGGIGGGAQAALAEAGIKLYGGVAGDADEQVNAFLQNQLAYNPDVHCEHHHEHGYGEGHSCGEHSCH